jgi:dihydrofolate reductase
MKKIKLYIAASLNGKIARQNGSVDWLESIPNPEKNDYGYSKFYESVDVILMGNNTYQQIISWGIDFPYADKKNYVLTTNHELKNNKFVEFVSSNHIEFIKNLKTQEGKDIWLVGGGKINTLLLNNDLIDEIHIFIMPIILPDGIEVFEDFPKESNLKLTNSKTHDTGVVEMIYRLN